MSFVITSVGSVGEAVVVSLKGELTFEHSPDFHRAMQEISQGPPKHLIVDLAELTYIDSSGVGTLVEILRRYKLKFELRTSSDDEVCYDVQVPLELPTDRVSNAILKLDPEGHASVEWGEKKTKNK